MKKSRTNRTVSLVLPRPRTVSALISLWPSVEEFAKDAGCTFHSVYNMRYRNRINRSYWLRIVQGAEARGWGGIGWDLMEELHTKRAA